MQEVELEEISNLNLAKWFRGVLLALFNGNQQPVKTLKRNRRRTLLRQGFIRYAPFYGYKLTEKGLRYLSLLLEKEETENV